MLNAAPASPLRMAFRRLAALALIETASAVEAASLMNMTFIPGAVPGAFKRLPG